MSSSFRKSPHGRKGYHPTAPGGWGRRSGTGSRKRDSPAPVPASRASGSTYRQGSGRGPAEHDAARKKRRHVRGAKSRHDSRAAFADAGAAAAPPARDPNEECVYILRLAGGKRYVGKSTYGSVNGRIRDHRSGSGRGAAWTTLNPVTDVEAIVPGGTDKERSVTLQQMSDHGIDAVRGSVFAQRHLPDASIGEIARSIRDTRNACWSCGGRHYSSNCYATRSQDGFPPLGRDGLPLARAASPAQRSDAPAVSDGGSVSAGSSEVEEVVDERRQRGACFRCGHFGHWASSCFATSCGDDFGLIDDDDASETGGNSSVGGDSVSGGGGGGWSGAGEFDGSDADSY